MHRNERIGNDNKVARQSVVLAHPTVSWVNETRSRRLYRAPYQENLVFDIPAHNKILVVEFFFSGLFSSDV